MSNDHLMNEVMETSSSSTISDKRRDSRKRKRDDRKQSKPKKEARMESNPKEEDKNHQKALLHFYDTNLDNRQNLKEEEERLHNNASIEFYSSNRRKLQSQQNVNKSSQENCPHTNLDNRQNLKEEEEILHNNASIELYSSNRRKLQGQQNVTSCSEQQKNYPKPIYEDISSCDEDENYPKTVISKPRPSSLPSRIYYPSITPFRPLPIKLEDVQFKYDDLVTIDMAAYLGN